MSDPYLGEIRIVGFTFAPRGWALCNGQLLAIKQNTALFSLLGTTYGGDGKTTFGLPNFQDIAPMNQGEGPGLTPRSLGENSGSATVTLLQSEMPSHSHAANASNDSASTNVPTDGLWAMSGDPRAGVPMYTTNGSSPTQMNIGALTPQGKSQAHNNMQPYLTLNFIIALQGIFPPRS
jgi:microcystin-dependent protein